MLHDADADTDGVILNVTTKTTGWAGTAATSRIAFLMVGISKHLSMPTGVVL